MLQALASSIGFSILALAVAEVTVNRYLVRAVKGSLQRYRLSTIRRLLSWTANGLILLLVPLGLILGYPIGAAINLIFGILLIRIELRRNNDDDDWFNGRWKKIKRGVKNAAKKVATAIPTPTPVPSGA